jgi:ATP phosphoribosyltransferase
MTQQQLNNLLKEGNTLKKEALSLLEQETKGNAALAAEFKKSNKQYNDIVSKLKEINGEITEAKKKQSDRISTLMQEEQKLKGLSGIQASFVGLERDRIKLMSKSDSMNSSTRDKLSSIRSLNDELLGLSAEDEVSKAVIEQKIQDIMKGMKGLGADAQAQLDIEKEKFDKAKNLSSLTEKQQGLLNKQMAVYEGMKDTIGGIL